MKEEKTDYVNMSIRLSKAERERWKTFFKAYGVSVTQGLEMAYSHLEEDVKNGKIRIDRAGIHKCGKEDL